MRLKSISIKALFIIGIILLAVLFLTPTFFGNWPHKKINLGLDLQGGMHLVLEVENMVAVQNEVDRIVTEMRKVLRKKNIKPMVNRLKDNTIALTVKAEDKSNAEEVLSDDFGTLKILKTTPQSGNIEFHLSFSDEEIESIKKFATEQALETIRNRIDEFGVSEPDIRVQGGDRIILQLPGIDDPERAKALIGKTAQLTFQLVDDKSNPNEFKNKPAPPGTEKLYEIHRTPAGEVSRQLWIINKRVLLSGNLLTDARVQRDQYGKPEVGIEFDRKGARIFERITGENEGRLLAIVLDKKVYSAPRINGRISGGRAVITGGFTFNEAKDLAIALRAGSLPAPVHIIEERTVGPTLGSDSIRMGLFSMLVGGALVVFFMMVYYKMAGVVADLALVVNIILIGGGLAAFGATLTLPGIAGIILTIGMAVDANVIIFERIREEIRSGKTSLASVQSGFERATLTILDANVTTIIAAAVLAQFGTGAVRGFAVTLILGIIASLFTALILSRSLLVFIVKRRQIAKLSI